MSGEERRGSPEAAVQFQHRLATLKRTGCNILLVGAGSLDAACKRLLGESSAGPRHRVFVTTDAGAPTARARLGTVRSGVYGDEAVVVNWEPPVRSGTPTDGASNGTSSRGAPGEDSRGRDSAEPPLRSETVESGDLRDLGSAIEETIERFDTATEGFSPAELRLCFDSVAPLVDGYEDRDVRRFLLRLTETVERFDGMAHYHLPAEYETEAVASLEMLFDAVVEVRQATHGVEQRWHLEDPEITTDWLAL